MNFEGLFSFIGKVDVTDLHEHILGFSEDIWNQSDWRQNTFKAHTDTSTIPLIFDADYRHTNSTVYPEYDRVQQFIAPILMIISRHYNKSLKYKRLQKQNGKAYPVRAIIARLSPGGIIAPHIDRHFSLSHAHRIHVPIQTDQLVEFKIAGQQKYLRQGEIWEINNRQIHQVANKSDIQRIHLIIDWAIPGERCCCGKKLRPKGECSPELCRATSDLRRPCDCYSL